MNTQSLDLSFLCKKVCEAALEAGAYIREEQKRFNPQDSEELKSFNSLVSYVDRTAEQMLVSRLLDLLPDSGIIGEEGVDERPGEEYTWIIDPLDGTTNFIHGIPCYAVSIALQFHKELLIGVVYEISKDECFYAWKDGGAYLNGAPIRVSPRTELRESLLATGFPYYDFGKINKYLNLLQDLMQVTRGIRRLGSAATDLAYVACGRFESFYEYGLSPWDVAGGAIIVQESGGLVSDFSGGDNYVFGNEIVASCPPVHEGMLEVIRKHAL